MHRQLKLAFAISAISFGTTAAQARCNLEALDARSNVETVDKIWEESDFIGFVQLPPESNAGSRTAQIVTPILPLKGSYDNIAMASLDSDGNQIGGSGANRLEGIARQTMFVALKNTRSGAVITECTGVALRRRPLNLLMPLFIAKERKLRLTQIE